MYARESYTREIISPLRIFMRRFNSYAETIWRSKFLRREILCADLILTPKSKCCEKAFGGVNLSARLTFMRRFKSYAKIKNTA